MAIRDKIDLDYKNSLKLKDKIKISTYRLILSGIKELDIINRSASQKKETDDDDIKKLLSESNGIKLEDDTKNFKYPMPIYAKGKDDVFVGRIRKDFSCENSLNLWVVSDNLRKGAATNAIQILELIKSKGFIS